MSAPGTDSSQATKTGLRLVELCREGKFEDALNELYHQDIKSIEAAAMPGMEQVQNGLDAVRAKNQWWMENNEVHSCEVAGPYPQPDQNRFAVHFKLDTTCKMRGRQQMEEVALYTVDAGSGKIIQEEFMYMT